MTERILIIGGPRTGKTTLARQLSTAARSTDDLIHLGWSEASEAASHWFDDAGPWVIEGVAVVRALRKWFLRNPIVDSTRTTQRKACDRIISLRTPHVSLTPGQLSMADGHETIWGTISHGVSLRGIPVEYR